MNGQLMTDIWRPQVAPTGYLWHHFDAPIRGDLRSSANNYSLRTYL